MLTEIEEKVLKYIIENGSPTQGIYIKIDNIQTPFLIQAVKTLDSLGLVKNCSDLQNAGAFLTEKGFTYFKEQEKLKYGVYYDDIKLIEKNIAEIEKLQDNEFDHDKFAEILEIHNDIKDIKQGITNYRKDSVLLELDKFEKEIPFDSNKRVLIERLNRQKNILLQKINKDKNSKITNVFKPQNTNNVVVNNNIKISLQQITNNIINLKDDELSANDKVVLLKMLNELEDLKNKKKEKKKFSDKIKDFGKWIFDKGIPTISAVLPYILQLIQGN